MTIYMRTAVSGFLFAATRWGQLAFQNLAPNGDGSVVYFCSPLRTKGTGQIPALHGEVPLEVTRALDGWRSLQNRRVCNHKGD
jgi:hypothetical protein